MTAAGVRQRVSEMVEAKRGRAGPRLQEDCSLLRWVMQTKHHQKKFLEMMDTKADEA